jgi:hypothetical protein
MPDPFCHFGLGNPVNSLFQIDELTVGGLQR